MRLRNLVICLSILLPTLCVKSWAQSALPAESSQVKIRPLHNAELVGRLYQLIDNQMFWLYPGEDYTGKRLALIDCIAGSDSFGLTRSAYPLQELSMVRNIPEASEEEILKADYLITDAAIDFLKDLYAGQDMPRWLSFDGISANYSELDNSHILAVLSGVKTGEDFRKMVQSLEPACEGYSTLKSALMTQLAERNIQQQKQLSSSLNYYRWIRHFHLDSFIVINIASATLDYYKEDSLVMSMRAVMGKPETKTPRFAAYLKEVTLYPYWNMPRSILVNEWLPNIKRNPSLLNFLEMEIIDGKGKVVPTSKINWRTVSGAAFPYRIRQKTGCLNPLGVVKFTLNSPYDIYLHDTNFKGAFLASSRFYSHGCIRIQDPVGLADAVLVNKVDTGFLRACFRDQAPQVLPVAAPVPVFVVYMTAEPGDAGSVRYYRDVYKLLK